MDAFPNSHSEVLDSALASLFTAGPPALGLEARPDTLAPAAARAAVTAMLESIGREPEGDRRRLLEGLALLWHDDWEGAHEIAQSREGVPDFDLLHAILHRREGDFGNSGYWFRRAGKHPCYPILERRLADPRSGLQAFLAPQGRWSPEAFLDKVSAVSGGNSQTRLRLMQVQAEESRAFAAHLLAIPPGPDGPVRT